MSRICKKCGGAVKMEDQFCMHCGMPLEKEESVREENRNDNKAEVLSMGDYLLMLILLAIPVVNFIVCILWIISGNGNPNRKNFAKAWLIISVVGTILSGILAFGAFQFIVMDHYVDIHEHIEYRTPEEQFIEDFLTELNEV
ncbi:MAG: hypothetical protein IJA25_00040 [Anaerotignum sp.]|nr:hypothetical protein [Anaerotignum sp.]